MAERIASTEIALNLTYFLEPAWSRLFLFITKLEHENLQENNHNYWVQSSIDKRASLEYSCYSRSYPYPISVEHKMTQTTDNLKAAFAGESQASRKYMAFAQKADQEGHPQIARLFRAAAQAETVHAANHLRALGGISSTAENLQTAITGENYEVISMYPPFIDAAGKEDNKAALTSFTRAWEVEKIHEELYRGLLAQLEQGKAEEEAYDYYVCPVCGHTHPRNAPEKCPICGVSGSRFERIS